jgi:DNA-binding MarR family transcriptional regulator
MPNTTRIANEAWEALYRAQATLFREFNSGDVWGDLSAHEYGVLYALAGQPDGLRISELREDVLLTQPGMSRLIARMEAGGLVERVGDPADGRASRIRLTAAGADAQRAAGRRHARHITEAMTRTLSPEQLEQLRDLSRALIPERTRV